MIAEASRVTLLIALPPTSTSNPERVQNLTAGNDLLVEAEPTSQEPVQATLVILDPLFISDCPSQVCRPLP